MNENTENLCRIEVEDDVEGHRMAAIDGPDEDDVRAHLYLAIDGPDADDVEAHIQPPRGDDSDHLHS
jgi:hypothetical protein